MVGVSVLELLSLFLTCAYSSGYVTPRQDQLRDTRRSATVLVGMGGFRGVTIHMVFETWEQV